MADLTVVIRWLYNGSMRTNENQTRHYVSIPVQCEDCARPPISRCDNCGLPFCEDHLADRPDVPLCHPCNAQLHPDPA
jgi:hypothetical protein